MALGSWQDPATGKWMDLYDTESDLPVSFPRGDYVAFQNPSALSAEGKELLFYENSGFDATVMERATILTSKPYAVPVEALPYFMKSARANGDGTLTYTPTRPTSKEYYSLMAEDGIAPPQPRAIITTTVVICLIILAAIITVGVCILIGNQQKITMAAMAAQSQEIQNDTSYDVDGDGTDDVRQVVYASGYASRFALTEAGRTFLGSSQVVDNEGLDFSGLTPGGGDGTGDIPWGWLAVGGVAITGVAVVMYVGKGSPTAGLERIMKMQMLQSMMPKRAPEASGG